MPILSLDKRGRPKTIGFDGIWSDITSFVGGVASGVGQAVYSVGGIIYNTLEEATAAMLEQTRIAKEAAEALQAGYYAAYQASKEAVTESMTDTKVASSTLQSASVGILQNTSNLAINQAAAIIQEASTVKSIVSNPSNAGDLIIQEALRQAALINDATTLVAQPVAALPGISQTLAVTEAGVSSGAAIISDIPVVGSVLPLVGQSLEKIPVVGDIVEGSAIMVANNPVTGGLVKPLLDITGFSTEKQRASEGTGPQVIEQINYVYETEPEQEASSAQRREKNFLEHPLAVFFR